MKDAVLKVLVMAEIHVSPILNHMLQEDIENSTCFQIISFDFMMDAKIHPVLIEVNAEPSLATPGTEDYYLKRTMITDVLKLLLLSTERRKNYKEERKLKK